jgi:hypothetical protein
MGRFEIAIPFQQNANGKAGKRQYKYYDADY